MAGNKETKKRVIKCHTAYKRRQGAKTEALKKEYVEDDKVYQRFFNIANDMFCIAGLDGYFKLINPALKNMLGYTEEELFAKPYFDLLHPDDREKNIEEVKCLKNGVPIVSCEYRYICKDGSYRWLAWTSHTDVDEGLIYAVARDITEKKQMENEISSLKDHLLSGRLEHKEAFSPIITRSGKMMAIFQYIEAVAESLKPVFITGETGAGKELIAGAIHNVRNLKGKLVSVNVAGLDDTMFSDTLFGHMKGAYTGADRERKGLILQASGGSLHLDEIGDLSESSQVKLLRLLEERTYFPLGSDMPDKSDARIIASSSRDIQALIWEGKFRKDLYYRLCTHHIHIPPLRERLEDIPLLLDYFIGEASKSLKKKKPALSRELIILLSNYHFPGNIRELQAMAYDAVAQHKSGNAFLDSFKSFIKDKGLSSNKISSVPAQGVTSIADFFGHFPTLKETEDYMIYDAMMRADSNQGIAASMLGITRQALNRRLRNKVEKK